MGSSDIIQFHKQDAVSSEETASNSKWKKRSPDWAAQNQD